MTKSARKPNPFVGRWRINKTEAWETDDLDLVGPAQIQFGADGLGDLRLIAIDASVDYRVVDRGGVPHVEFSWSGQDESEPTCGRGWGRLDGDLLKGELFIHAGDDSTFIAKRQAARSRK